MSFRWHLLAKNKNTPVPFSDLYRFLLYRINWLMPFRGSSSEIDLLTFRPTLFYFYQVQWWKLEATVIYIIWIFDVRDFFLFLSLIVLFSVLDRLANKNELKEKKNIKVSVPIPIFAFLSSMYFFSFFLLFPRKYSSVLFYSTIRWVSEKIDESRSRYRL